MITSYDFDFARLPVEFINFPGTKWWEVRVYNKAGNYLSLKAFTFGRAKALLFSDIIRDWYYNLSK